MQRDTGATAAADESDGAEAGVAADATVADDTADATDTADKADSVDADVATAASADPETIGGVEAYVEAQAAGAVEADAESTDESVDEQAAGAQPAAPEAPHDSDASDASNSEPAAPAELSPAACAARLAELFPAVFTPGASKPLKLRIQADIQQRATGVFTRRSLSNFLHRHTTSSGYLRALGSGAVRFDLDGVEAGTVSDEHREAARAELARRKGLHDVRRAVERESLRQAQREARKNALPGAPSDAPPGAVANVEGQPRPERSGARPPRPGAPGGARPPGDAQRRMGSPGGDAQRPPRPQRQGDDAQRPPRDQRPDGQRAARGQDHGPQRPRHDHEPQRPRQGHDAQRPPRGQEQRDAQHPPRSHDRAARGQEREGERPISAHVRDGASHIDRGMQAAATNATPESAAQAEARRERAAMLRAFETTTLTLSNFCALKAIKPADLETVLAQARTEREQAPRPSMPRHDRGDQRPSQRTDRRPDQRPDQRRADPRDGGGPRGGSQEREGSGEGGRPAGSSQRPPRGH